ncbi:hypothetical protein RclHR1_15400007 [Rhizophagus clarus]|uniref:Uncharacterized protein n=1 Tax=Rhizophagus clarus TaxID=94130 RepID=A0A2Z6QU66_9GLOM|nr:hypothetical protein RclHR1_15400007 [Rhizophagus clarus]GES86115.1 hypothetical protein RCL_e3148_RclHR1_15400007 [Rhizophagus clarus]GES98508.1 hypothetical protein RCL_e3149_RclHR1_15400007 [Rhizophagus clarus]
MTRTDTNVARRKLRSSRASRGQNNKKKHNKPSKAVRRRHFRRKGIDKPQKSEGLAQQALEVAGELFVTKEEEVEKLQQEINQKNGELGHYKELAGFNRDLREQVFSLTKDKERYRREREGWKVRHEREHKRANEAKETISNYETYMRENNLEPPSTI